MTIRTFTRSHFRNPIGSVMQSLSPWLPGRWFLAPTQSSRCLYQTFPFLDLPLEVRACIYEYLVVVGKVFYTPERYATQLELRLEDPDTFRAPALQLLRVCKQIREEVEAIYVSKILFMLPHHWYCCPPFGDVHYQTRTHPWSMFAARTLPRIKRVSICFNGRCCSPFNSRKIEADRLNEDSHKADKTKLALCWLRMLRQLYDPRDGSTALDLDFLELDFTEAYCPMGCCRMLTSGSMLAKVLRPKRLQVLGLTEN